MPQQTRMVWKAKVVEPEPTSVPKDGKREKGKGKSKQEVAPRTEPPAMDWRKGDRSKGDTEESWERRRDNKWKDSGAKGSPDTTMRGKQNDGKSGMAKGKSKEGPNVDESSRRKGGKAKGGGDGGGKSGRGKSGGQNPGNARTVQELESEMAKKRDHDVTKQPLEADGESCNVKKHSGMGCAVITMKSERSRDAVLERARQRHKGGKNEATVVEFAGIDVQVKPHTDKSTQQVIPTDIFAAWGHQTEKNHPLEAHSIADFFDELHREVQAQATHTANPMLRGPATLATVPPLPSTYSPQQAPPPPPAHVPKVGQILQSAAFVQPHPTSQPQHPPAQQPAQFPEQQYQYYMQQQLAQQQYLQAQQQQQQQQQYLLAQTQQYYQDQDWAYQQQQQQQMAYSPVGKTPKPLQIKDPRTGSVIDTLGMNFKKNEGNSPQKIIDPSSGELVSPERLS